MDVEIKMLHTKMGTENGHTVREYKKGETYQVTPWLASWFFKQDAAVKVNKE